MARPKKAATPSSSGKGFYKCPHCDLVYDFPFGYCEACGSHTHTIFMGSHLSIVYEGKEIKKPDNICSHCFKGKSKKGIAWRRAQGNWKPDNDWDRPGWDDPEWYDGAEEWKNTTLQLLWIDNAHNIEEL